MPLTDAELARITPAYAHAILLRTPCRAARLFSGILDRTVTCLDADDALTRLKAAADANQKLRNSPVRTP